MFYDHVSDPDLATLAEIAGADNAQAFRADLARQFDPKNPLTKLSRAKPVYAWPDKQLFPVHTCDDAVMSWMYAVKQASELPKEVLRTICDNVSTYGYDAHKLAVEVRRNMRDFADAVKVASAAENSDEYLYAIPDMQRLRIDTPDLVKQSAHVLLENQSRLFPATVKLAAVNIVKRAAEYQMSTDDLPTDVYKHAGVTRCHVETLVGHLEARIGACYLQGDKEGEGTYEKLANAVKNSMTTTGYFSSRPKLSSIVETIGLADETHSLSEYEGILSPQLAVFNSDKLSEESADVAGLLIPWRKLYALDKGFYEDILGGSFVEHITDSSGEVDPQKLKEVLPTLPLPQKKALATQLKAYA